MVSGTRQKIQVIIADGMFSIFHWLPFALLFTQLNSAAGVNCNLIRDF